MPSVKDYFEKNTYKPKWFIGDRVEGKWNNIPFVGTVGNDSRISEYIDPETSIFLDLPIKFKEKVYNIITVKSRDLKVRK